MPIAFKCPKCGKQFNVKDELAGKPAACPCGVTFKIPGSKPAAAPAPAPAAPVSSPAPTPVPAPAAPAKQAAPAARPPTAAPAAKAVPKKPAPQARFAAPATPAKPVTAKPAAKPVLSPAEETEPFPEPKEDSPEEQSVDKKDNLKFLGGKDKTEAASLKDEEDEEEAEEGGEKGGEGGALKIWAGRVLIWVGAACILAALFLPWADIPAEWKGASASTPMPAPKKEGASPKKGEAAPAPDAGATKTGFLFRTLGMSTAAAGEEAPAAPAEGAAAPAADAKPADAAPAAAEAKPADAPAPAAAEAGAVKKEEPKLPVTPASEIVKGLDLPKEFPAESIFLAAYVIPGAALLLAFLALIPGVVLSGKPQMILGLLLTLAVAGATGALLFGLSARPGCAGFGGVIAPAPLGMYLTLAGAGACFVGGLLCSFGVFSASPASGKERNRSAMATRSTVRMSKKPGASAATKSPISPSGSKPGLPKPSAAKMKPVFSPKRPGATPSKAMGAKPGAGLKPGAKGPVAKMPVKPAPKPEK
jgi:hypothetical protein